MSAMHAMALPEDDPDSQAAAICRFHGRTVRTPPVRGQAPVAETVRLPATANRTVHGQTAAIQTTRGRKAPSQLAPSQATPAQATPAQAAPAQAALTRAALSKAALTQAAPAQTAPRRASTSPAARGPAPRHQTTANAPLRLTRRGRVVIAAAAALLVLAVSLIAAGAAQATNHSVPSRVAEQNLSRVVVRPGQTLWSVAESADPHADTRVVIQQIVDLNGLTSDVVLAGQRLWVPRG